MGLKKKLNKMARKLSVRNGKVVDHDKTDEQQDEEVELDD
jgi:hypothetical protein